MGTMMHPRDPILFALQKAYLLSLKQSHLRFFQAAKCPERAQGRRLRQILSQNAESLYGKAHRFSRIFSVESFQDLPVMEYDALEPWIMRAARGERGVLTTARVEAFEKTGGSTSPNKLIPYTKGLLAEFSAATDAWIHDLYRNLPGLLGTKSYWVVSPVVRHEERTEGGIPIGLQDETDYFNPLSRWALRRMMVVPSSLARMTSIEAWRKATAVHLLEERRLGLISVWHPSFLTLLLEYMERHRAELTALLSPKRAKEISALGPGLPWEEVWPALRLVSCWTDAGAKEFVPSLRQCFPNVCIQGKGLLATEGVVSIPIRGQVGCALAVNGHFLEFVDLQEEGKRPLPAHRLRIGGEYSPLLTTLGGLYRYALKDVVRCVGKWMGVPLVRFEGKLDGTSDLCGEKMTVLQAEKALAFAREKTGLDIRFAMLSPRMGTPPFYRLWMDNEECPDEKEGRFLRFGACVEEWLLQSHHYRYCRELGQLGKIEVFRIPDALALWQKGMAANGSRIGSQKPLALDKRSILERTV